MNNNEQLQNLIIEFLDTSIKILKEKNKIKINRTQCLDYLFLDTDKKLTDVIPNIKESLIFAFNDYCNLFNLNKKFLLVSIPFICSKCNKLVIIEVKCNKRNDLYISLKANHFCKKSNIQLTTISDNSFIIAKDITKIFPELSNILNDVSRLSLDFDLDFSTIYANRKYTKSFYDTFGIIRCFADNNSKLKTNVIKNLEQYKGYLDIVPFSIIENLTKLPISELLDILYTNDNFIELTTINSILYKLDIKIDYLAHLKNTPLVEIYYK